MTDQHKHLRDFWERAVKLWHTGADETTPFIAALDPDTVLSLLDTIESQAARIATAERLAEALNNDPHVVEFRPDGWSLRHPVLCRGDMFACDVHRYLDAQPKPLKKPGRYTVLAHTDGFTFTTERPDGIVAALAAFRKAGA